MKAALDYHFQPICLVTSTKSEEVVRNVSLNPGD